ncbi:GDSL esterase/lipase [Trifolium pratense]|uniref:GDSL esterase/lipase n=1 Tax=Trifolium pratense TaxID=57577 RepID=A0A2K3K1D7_TRIPR|nr:GDSL esterase/lipase [Trifolium pratense]
MEDCIVWNSSKSGNLSLKEAYEFKSATSVQVHWASNIWSNDMPPSKSLVAWRLRN